MRFDWYSGTFTEDVGELVGAFAANLGAEVEEGRGLHGYTRGYELKNATGTVARFLGGGPNGRPTGWASGEDTDAFVDVARGLYPDRHYVTRFDSAEDFVSPDAFEELQSACLTIADERRLKVNQAGDWHRREEGRTIYIGSRKSPVFIRLYEKGLQMRAKVAEGADEIPSDWVRLEVQVRPGRHARDRAAVSTPEEAWGFSGWTQELSSRVLALEVERVPITVWRQPDDERAFDFMMKQYGDMLERRVQRLGSWTELGKRMELHQAAKAARRA